MDSAQEWLLRQLLSTYRCSSCRRPFEREYVDIVARHDKLWVVSARCSSCHTQQMFWVSLRSGISAVDSEVSPVEHRRFATLPPISFDDVLDMHEFLKHFNGDFRALFARRHI